MEDIEEQIKDLKVVLFDIEQERLRLNQMRNTYIQQLNGLLQEKTQTEEL